MKHTQGEWTKGTNTATKDWMTIYASGKPIAEVKPINKKGERQAGDFETEEANARLIAAAPDLLEALEEAIFHVDSVFNPNLKGKCEAAISKAKGE